jgi:membrane-bound lytic murein transglycosylase A
MIPFVRSSFFRRVLLFATLSLLAGCSWFQRPVPSPEPALVRLAVDDYPDFSDGFFLDNLSHGIGKSLEYLQRVPAERTFRFGEDTYDARHLMRSLEALQTLVDRRPGPEEVNRFMARAFRVYRSTGGPESGQVLFTGYYEPHLKGSLTPDARYRYPVYARPRDLMVIDLARFSEDFCRQAHRRSPGGQYRGALPGPAGHRGGSEFCRLAPPIAWVDDRIDLFFLQIQGSGRIYLAEGGFHPGALPRGQRPTLPQHRSTAHRPGQDPGREMSMQRLRGLSASPSRRGGCRAQPQPQLCFLQNRNSGPIGAIGVDLTPGRSVAVDRRVFPMAAPAFLQTRIPVVDGNGRIDRWMDFSAFALNQDTGGAIRGPGRVDIFWGNGPYAQIAAGHMQHKGNFYLLVLDSRNAMMQWVRNCIVGPLNGHTKAPSILDTPSKTSTVFLFRN